MTYEPNYEPRHPHVGQLVCYRPSDYDEPTHNFPGSGPYPAWVTAVYDDMTPGRLGPYVDLRALGKKYAQEFKHVPNGGGWHSWDIINESDPPEWLGRLRKFTEWLLGKEPPVELEDVT